MNDAKLNNVCIGPNATVREALQQLCSNAKRILFVVEGKRLIGTLADGDVRRFLLRGGALDSLVRDAAHMSPRFVFTSERRDAETKMREADVSAMPIVDDDMNLMDVVFLHDTVDLKNVVIRVLVSSDLEMVLDFFDQMAGDTRAMFNRNDVNRVRAIEHLKRTEPDGQIHFAAVVKDDVGCEKMVGYVFLWDTDKKIPWLGIAIREDWKGHHLGRVLLSHLDDWAKPKGYGGLMLTSVPANVRAHALYTRMGFEYFGVYPDSEFLYIKRYEI